MALFAAYEKNKGTESMGKNWFLPMFLFCARLCRGTVKAVYWLWEPWAIVRSVKNEICLKKRSPAGHKELGSRYTGFAGPQIIPMLSGKPRKFGSNDYRLEPKLGVLA